MITGSNVVEVTPNAPVAGFTRGGLDVPISPGDANRGTGDVFVEVLDARPLADNARYTVTIQRPRRRQPRSTRSPYRRAMAWPRQRHSAFPRRGNRCSTACAWTCATTCFASTRRDGLYGRHTGRHHLCAVAVLHHAVPWRSRARRSRSTTRSASGSRRSRSAASRSARAAAPRRWSDTSFSVVNYHARPPVRSPFSKAQLPATDAQRRGRQQRGDLYLRNRRRRARARRRRAHRRPQRPGVREPAGGGRYASSSQAVLDHRPVHVRRQGVDDQRRGPGADGALAAVPNPYVGAASWEAPLPRRRRAGAARGV